MVKLNPTNENGLAKVSSIDCFQIRSLSHERLIKKIGEIDYTTLQQIKEAISKVLDF